MEITITHTDVEYDEDDNETETETELTVEANYLPGEAESRWGYYGATPGYPSEVEIESVTVPLEVEGPHRNPWANDLVRVMSDAYNNEKFNDRHPTIRELEIRSRQHYKQFVIREYNNFKCPNGPVVYMIPWDGKLSDEDIREIEDIVERAVKEARADAAIDAYESRMEYGD